MRLATSSASRRFASRAAAVAVLAIGSAVCSAGTNVTVNGTSGPWVWANGGLNSSYNYDAFFNNQAAPTTVTSGGGVTIQPGSLVSVTYVSGTVSIGAGYPNTDAGGNTAIPENNRTDPDGDVWPSYFMNPSTYPINSSELVGTFANSSGAIVGTPFAVGNSSTLNVPAGASQLQLGVNDTNYNDNTGAWTVAVSNVVPEPASIGLFAGAGASLLIRRRRQSSVMA